MDKVLFLMSFVIYFGFAWIIGFSNDCIWQLVTGN